MSAKKNDKKIFTLTNNTDLSDDSDNSVNSSRAKNTDKTIRDKTSNLSTEMSRKLGAKYYVEEIAEENETEQIFSLESLRDVFLSVKANVSGQRKSAEIRIADNDDSQDTFDSDEVEKSIAEFTKESAADLLENRDKEITVDFPSEIYDTDNDNIGEESEIEQDEILEQTVGEIDVEEITIPVSPELIFEAMLFVGDRENKPITASRAAEKMRNVQPQEIDEAVKTLNEKYDSLRTPYKIIEDAGGYRMVLREEFTSIQEKFYGKIREARLSQGAIDILAIIAYKQPITAEEIQNLRKQPSSSLISQLVRRGLIQMENEIKNKKKKILYKTTQRFLDLFQLDSIEDLPVAEDFDFK
ncbi:MAG: SMC-Scp complex subunit ScpB [Planctomycetaceae bacterium]|jgi:segregation and condensation protein B|nr:SMC-Scp complex subunit ScpB [Planctomycetaceae bacterium]